MKRQRTGHPVFIIFILFLSMQTFFSCSRDQSQIPCERQPPPAPDFGNIRDINLKKNSFFSFLSPVVRGENNRIQTLRQRLVLVREIALVRGEIPSKDRQWLTDLALDYEVPFDGDMPSSDVWIHLFRRVDTVPADLVMVQAAIESAWGTSRFAREGKNYFGQHCTVPGCGLVPGKRSRGHLWEVAVFDSVADSVKSYLHNLNTHQAYREFRRARAELRDGSSALDGMLLAGALSGYSERRDDYVKQVRAMIRANRRVMGL